ncbi:Dimethyl sulfoxide/trimethylamine N-oxide reductase [Aliiroseovarius sp. xm-m-379]|uniref:molybdopterin-dependent oxidoreductase n=1 Tax=unclassified Aliiroseovarius TaxID=2623558 RepID=UPI001568E5A7|nr:MULTISPECIES: molybdopterin-dependent oxidoreductase [unclassified Aliiroseovarius]NRP11755.1 Dimethyl sulfoxide/trimethylamine N-oxide reductase [Aliiroseovarius sp. xm-d-517]NRP26314.1 Dimethyl sulfoxide/trimethylamine N-oxide reductase [Aliiroseovarius sp. xm-m-379]NRP32082.1 Dimethyl sulfoxide/trimethylamine N-oxide reductase [Aliiroseovarius sp. xm-m-314]NRP35113.1 Dimethyl sulfoxide/trimethylamine N-oxide reductase [Aliiroseovarius sp. xm-a-104]NRP42674.1 Dimethyl sulfoxide/trimethyla
MSYSTPTRRAFLQGSAAAFGATSLMGSTALASIDPNSFSDRVFHASHFGPFEAVVRDGKLVGINTMMELDARPTEMLTYGVMDRTYDKTRINYPMVRKSYLEGWETGDIKPELRGREEWVRVDWDTAWSLAAKALLDTASNHGNEAIFSSSYGGWSNAGVFRPNVLQGRLLNLMGGCTNTAGDWSAGAGQVVMPHIIGDMEVYSAQSAWETIRDNTQVFVLVGCDPIKNNRIEYRVADHGMYAHWEEIRDNGVKFISINPQHTATDTFLGAERTAIIPNTDTALFLSMAYHALENGWDDQEYMAKYTVGADKWIAYVKGETDGVPKTPAWASAITGIDEQQIKDLCETIATNNTCIAGSWAIQRAQHGEMAYWSIVNFQALLGKIGKPGQGVGFSWHYGNGGMPQGGNATPVGMSQGRNFVKKIVPASRITEALENPGMEFFYNGQTNQYPDIKMIFNAGNNFMSHQQDTNRLIRALQKVETIVSVDVWWTAATRWADIVFPASSTLEQDDITSGGTYSNDRVYAMKKVIEPIADSKPDYEIFEGLADKLGLWAQFTDSEDKMYHIKLAYEASGAAKDLPFEEFWEKGYARMPVPAEARKWTRHGAFYDDPEANPLHTSSGKIEMFCDTIASFELEDCPGMPMWMEKHEYLGNAKKGQLHVVSPHPWFRLHSQMANSERLRDLYMVQGREPVRINAQDAAERGIEDGDLVELYNKRGTVIAGAVVSDDIMPGVVSIYEGGWPQLDSKGRDNSGLANFLTSTQRASGLSEATTANTALIEMRKCEDPEGPNRAYEPPAIIDDMDVAEIDSDKLGLERLEALTSALYADMTPGEKMFFERCTVCHAPREVTHYTQQQWKGIVPSMFERAGLDDGERALVMEYLMTNAADAK